MNDLKENRAQFSGRIGYIMAAAGSAVGLGNIWRFPYLAAKYGGGAFLLTYLILTVTVGFALIMSETALGRMTKKSPIGAFNTFGRSGFFKLGGWLNALVPMIIVPYYCVIGGWVFKYLFEYITGNGALTATSTYFSTFTQASGSVEMWFVLFSVLVVFVVLRGVQSGVEKTSKFMMPILIVLAIIVAIYSMIQPGAMAGVKYFLIPEWENFSFMTIVAAMGQMFYSLSIAMGILYTYGSYLDRNIDIEKTTKQLEIFDTGIAVLAGLMIIPAVFAFNGGSVETLKAGPSLMFITLPNVFKSMGMGGFVGAVFFLMVLFAALTSAISLMETCVSTFEDQLGWSRTKASLVMGGEILLLGTASALGFGVWSNVTIFGMSILDFFDFLSNSVLMPLAALFTCVLILKYIGLDRVAAEVGLSSEFKRRKNYEILIKYFVPVAVIIIFLSSLANAFGIITM